MNIEIITKSLPLAIYGFGDTAINKDYVGTAFKMSGKMWEIVKAKELKNKGLNVWVYEPEDMVFAGVDLENPALGLNSGLEEKKIILTKYASYKHIGPYNLIKQTGQKMTSELISMGYEVILPYIEIYGHWTNDESELETELLMSLK
jgi:predicted transcriptional regulator YdeE